MAVSTRLTAPPAVNALLRTDIMRYMGSAPRRALLSQLQSLLVAEVPMSQQKTASEDFFLAFPSEWPDESTDVSAKDRTEYEEKRANVYARAQVCVAV